MCHSWSSTWSTGQTYLYSFICKPILIFILLRNDSVFIDKVRHLRNEARGEIKWDKWEKLILLETYKIVRYVEIWIVHNDLFITHSLMDWLFTIIFIFISFDSYIPNGHIWNMFKAIFTNRLQKRKDYTIPWYIYIMDVQP